MLRVLATVDRRGMLRKEGIETFSSSDFHYANTPFRGIVFDPVGKRRSLAKQQPPKGILPGTRFSRRESSCVRHLPMRRSTSPIALNSLTHVARWLDLAMLPLRQPVVPGRIRLRSFRRAGRTPRPR